MSLAMLANQLASQKIETNKTVDKWKLYRLLCQARPLLGITDRALALLNALLSFYPKQELAEGSGLIVFPSNAQLSLRAHGMAEQTIRRHLSVLIKAGLLIRKDSPNGKRYAHKDRAGGINEAFGFSLAPLIARVDEIERMATEVTAKRVHLQRLKERLTLCRRDIHKLVDAALAEGVMGDWNGVLDHLGTLIQTLPRVPGASEVQYVLSGVEALREDVVNQLETHLKIKNQSANPPQTERHIQNSDSESLSESEANCSQERNALAQFAAATTPRADTSRQLEHTPNNRQRPADGLKSFPLALVLKAAPQISDYAPGGKITTWRDLTSSALIIRSMLGVSPTAYEQACAVMGQENTAIVMACILERGKHINSAGGYLRDLTHRAIKNEFALGPMLMALLRSNGSAGLRTGERFPPASRPPIAPSA
jgi:replication initiation protein RepC